MDTFLRALGLVLLGVILSLVIGRQSRDISLLLSLGVCVGICAAAAGYLEPLMDFLGEIQSQAGLSREFLSVLLKCAGIGFLSELAGLICQDAGENAMGKAIQILSNAVVIFLSLPLLRQLLNLIGEVMGGL